MKGGYIQKRIKDICRKGSSNVAQKDLDGRDGIYPIYGASGLIKHVDFYHQEKECVGLVKDGAGVGRVMFLPPKSSVIGTMQYIIPNVGYSIKYIGYCLQSLDLSKYSQGATIPHIYFKDYGETTIFVPESLSEQKRIVEILDEEFANIDVVKANAEKNLKNAKVLFQATLRKELEPKDGWIECCLPDISENLDSKRVPITKSVRDKGSYPYYGASGVVDYVADYIFDGRLLLVSEDGANLLARSTPIAFSIDGKTWVNNHAHVLRFDDERKQQFVEYWFAGHDISSYITGTAQPKLNQKALNSIPIHMPSRERELENILDKIDIMSKSCRTLEENYQKTLSMCDDLKQALLRKAFNGEL